MTVTGGNVTNEVGPDLGTDLPLEVGTVPHLRIAVTVQDLAITVTDCLGLGVHLGQGGGTLLSIDMTGVSFINVSFNCYTFTTVIIPAIYRVNIYFPGATHAQCPSLGRNKNPVKHQRGKNLPNIRGKSVTNYCKHEICYLT